jgi:hypothetical protein
MLHPPPSFFHKYKIFWFYNLSFGTENLDIFLPFCLFYKVEEDGAFLLCLLWRILPVRFTICLLSRLATLPKHSWIYYAMSQCNPPRARVGVNRGLVGV